MKVTIQIDTPSVLYRARGEGSQSYYRMAARNLREGYSVGGSNTRNAIAELLDRVARAMDAAQDPEHPEPDAWRTGDPAVEPETGVES